MIRFRIVGLTRIAEHWSDQGDVFDVLAHAELQRGDGPGGEAFRVHILSPSMMQERLSSATDLEAGRGLLFCRDFDERVVRTWLQAFVDRAGTDDWHELQRYVERYFDWI